MRRVIVGGLYIKTISDCAKPRLKNRGQTPINSRAIRNFAARNYEPPLN